jgi:hypothetical protein
VRCEVTGDAERGGDAPLASWTAMSTSAPGHPDVVEDHQAAATASGPRPRRRRRPDVKLALASLAIAFGLVLIGYGLVRSVTGDEVTNLPSAIETISPVPDAVQVPAQTEILVDLAASYTGQLTIDGAALETVDISTLTNEGVEPGAQIDVPPGRVVFDPGNATLRFTPAEGTAIERFGEGNHTVRVTYWPIELGRAHAKDYTWTFHVV